MPIVAKKPNYTARVYCMLYLRPRCFFRKVARTNICFSSICCDVIYQFGEYLLLEPPWRRGRNCVCTVPTGCRNSLDPPVQFVRQCNCNDYVSVTLFDFECWRWRVNKWQGKCFRTEPLLYVSSALTITSSAFEPQIALYVFLILLTIKAIFFKQY
jgi:hypothetical protein